MSARKKYTCDICRDTINIPLESFGVHFSNQMKITLGGHSCTDGTHICFGCARQLKNHLNKPEIEKILTGEDCFV